MSVRNLDALFKPHSVALIGATNREGAVGRVVADNLFASGFSGPIMPVNPKHRAVRGVLSYESVTALPIAPDLAIITTPPATVPELIRTLGEKGTRAAVVISAGVTDSVTTEDGVGLRQAMLDAARPHLLRVLGPNCIGMIVPGLGLNASFAHVTPQAGDLAFLSQSGAMVTALLDQAAARGIGFSHVVSLGDKADVDFGDLLDYMAADPNTKAVILYVEAVRNARKFMSAARACSRLKPVIVIKSGRHAEGAKAAASHTGAMAGSDAVYHAAFRRAGMLRVYSIEELFDAAQTLATIPKTPGNRLAIVTNGGGLGVLATDTLVDDGGVLATLSDETVAALDACLPPTWSRANPVDIIGDAPGARYSASVEAVLHDDGVDALLVMNCPTAIASSEEAARAVVTSLSARRHRSGTGFGSDPVHGKAVFTTWMGEAAADEARKAFSDAQIPTYPTPEQAVRAFMHLVRHA
ncbi:MAG: CoA-binding protein, partial [Pseudomonadota bacterium]